MIDYHDIVEIVFDLNGEIIFDDSPKWREATKHGTKKYLLEDGSIKTGNVYYFFKEFSFKMN